MNADEYRAIVDVLLPRADGEMRPARDGFTLTVDSAAQPANIPEDALLRLYALLTSPHSLPALKEALSLEAHDVKCLIAALSTLIPTEKKEQLDKAQLDVDFAMGCIPDENV